MPAGASGSSHNAGLTGAYGSTSTQLNAAYSTAPGNSGFETVSRPLDEAVDSSSGLHLRFVYLSSSIFLSQKLPLQCTTWSQW